MPNTYAHYRFGQDVLRDLPETKQHQIKKNLPLYLIGLHGPDILFYYHPFITNSINSIGYQMHDQTGKECFTHFIPAVQNNIDPEAAYAYYMGFLCHFVLDSFCHPYIEEKIHRDHVYHTEIESAFDRMLLMQDGFNPANHSLVDHIVPTPWKAEVIAPFFKPARPSEVLYALRSMVRYGRLIATDSEPKRKVLMGLLKITGNYPEMHGMLVSKTRDPRFDDSNQKLLALFTSAKHQFPFLMHEAEELLEGKALQDTRFDHTFSYF